MLNHKQKNEIDGLPQFYKNSAIHFSGKNNRIKIGPKVFVKDSKIKLYGDSSLELEEGCYLQGCTFIIRNAHVKFGRCCELMNVKVSAFDGSYLEIGGNSAVTGEWELKDAATVTAKKLWCTWPPLVAAKGGKITMGDCGLADTTIYNTDYHPIYDFDGNIINQDRDVIIEDNVWVGRRTVILKGVTLGNGCILGFGSVVSRSIPPHCIAAGMPAKVVKENVVWAAHDDSDYKKYFPLTSETAADFFTMTKPKDNYETRKIKTSCRLLTRLKLRLALWQSKS